MMKMSSPSPSRPKPFSSHENGHFHTTSQIPIAATGTQTM